jgi:hypothetical protein
MKSFTTAVLAATFFAGEVLAQNVNMDSIGYVIAGEIVLDDKIGKDASTMLKYRAWVAENPKKLGRALSCLGKKLAKTKCRKDEQKAMKDLFNNIGFIDKPKVLQSKMPAISDYCMKWYNNYPRLDVERSDADKAKTDCLRQTMGRTLDLLWQYRLGR